MEFMAMIEANADVLVTIAFFAIVIGVVFGVIEMCIPGFGVFGGLGGLLCIAGIILRVLVNASWIVTILILILVIGFFTTMFIVVGKSAKSGRLSKSALVLSGTAVSTERSENLNDFSYLLGKIGVVKTSLRPVGKVEIDGELYDVVSQSAQVIDKDLQIKVVKIDGQNIQVSMA